MRGRPFKKLTPDQEKQHIKQRIKEFTNKLNQAPIQDRAEMLKNFQTALHRESKSFSVAAQKYRFQALSILNKSYQKAARQNLQSRVDGIGQVFKKAAQVKAVKTAALQAQASQTVGSKKPRSFWTRITDAISKFFRGTDRPKTQAAHPPRQETGPALAIADPQAMTPGMFGEVQAQTAIDVLEAEASHNHLPAFEGDPVNFGDQEDVELTDLSLVEASDLADAVSEAEEAVDREGSGTGLALDISETLRDVEKSSHQIATAFKNGISLPGNTLTPHSRTQDPDEPSPKPE